MDEGMFDFDIELCRLAKDSKMLMVEHLAAFVDRASYDDVSEVARQQLKIRVVDGLGCALGALKGETIDLIRGQIADFGGNPHSTLIAGGRTAPDRASFFNGALVRYLDFNDSYLAKGETCHPSDNIAPVLAAAEYANRSGRDFLTALAVAYQVQCRLSDEAPVRAKGFDHTTQGAFAVAAGVSKALGLDPVKAANAIAIGGTAFNALRVTRTGTLSHWKGLAYPNAAFGATHAAFLAKRGITGPLGVFEGNKGFMDAISGPFQIEWAKEDLERVRRTILKKFNAEVHSQATLEGIVELKRDHRLTASEVDRVEVETFDVAYNIIGGGEEGNKWQVGTKEQADHSLPYMVAVALLDGQVMPEQYLPDRIAALDAQDLLRRVFVRPAPDLTEHFPAEMACRIVLRLRDGTVLSKEKRDYEGFVTRPMRWDTVVQKFERLSKPYANARLRRQIVAAVEALDTLAVRDLTRLLGQAQSGHVRQVE